MSPRGSKKPVSDSGESRARALRMARTIQPTEVVHLLSHLPKRERARKLTWYSRLTTSLRAGEAVRRASQIERCGLDLSALPRS